MGTAVTDNCAYHIGYRGGSGGFLLLHLLLLSKKYHVTFQDNLDCNSVIDQQWHVKDHSQWKRNEVWPDNQQTLSNSSQLDKILFFCNPDRPRDFFDYCRNSTSKHRKFVWIYTDIHSHNELAFYKRAYWYFPKNSTKLTDLSTVSADWQGLQVDREAVYFLDHSDIQIKLQDLVNDPEILIKHQLLTDLAQDQLDLIQHWKSLHPPELLNAIGINIST